MTGFTLGSFLAGGLLAGAIVAGPAALAQQSTGGAAGITSGPANNSATTLGTGGETPTSPHQTQVLRYKGGPAIQKEKMSKGGPGEPGRPGRTGTESGRAPQLAGNAQGTAQLSR